LYKSIVDNPQFNTDQIYNTLKAKLGFGN